MAAKINVFVLVAHTLKTKLNIALHKPPQELCSEEDVCAVRLKNSCSCRDYFKIKYAFEAFFLFSQPLMTLYL